MVDPAFRERYLRSKRPKTLAKLMRAKRTSKAAVNNARRARLALQVDAAGGDLEALSVALGTSTDAAKKWLYQRTGSTLWPLDDARRAKLQFIAEKHN